MIRTWALALVLLAACGAPSGDAPGGLGSSSANDGVINEFNKQETFPNCSLYMDDDVINTPNAKGGTYLGEYDASQTKGGVHVSAIYTVDPGTASKPVTLPLGLSLIVGTSTVPILTLSLNQTQLQFSDAKGAVVLTVQNYATKSPTVTTAPTSTSLSGSALTAALYVARCEPPDQTALGAIPAFFENENVTTVGTSGVVGFDNDAPALIESWNGSMVAANGKPLTILEAFEIAVTNITPTGDVSAPLAWTAL